MKKPSISLLILVLVSTAAGAPATAPAIKRQLLVDGSPEMYWIARVDQDASGAVQTIIQFRPIGGEDWKRIAQLSQRVVSLTHRGNQLSVLLESGDWMTLWDGGASSGPSPDDSSKLLLLAGGNDTLWAIAVAGQGRQPTTASTQPAATMPAGTRLLYRLNRGRWAIVSPLPTDLQEGQLALTQIAGKPTAATLNGGKVHAFAWIESQSDWNSMGSFTAPPEATAVKLLADLDRPTAWVNSEQGGRWSVNNGGWSEPMQYMLPGACSHSAARDISVAGLRIRLVVEDEAGKALEYAFGPDGTTRGQSTILLPPAQQEPRSSEWLSTLAATLLVMVLVNSMRRQGPLPPAEVKAIAVRLAPYGRRFLAGTIDALPFIGTILITFARRDENQFGSVDSAMNALEIPFYISLAVYLLHTGVSEALWGWTVGKKLLGLRVVMIDGSRPHVLAIILRNVLRIIDVMVMPLLLIFLLPLRQRAGDIAAETLVIRDEVVEQTPPA